jgi:hypothetical protein
MSARSSRVRQLRLKLRLTGANHALAHDLRRKTEDRFLHDVLAACDRVVHQQLGADALVFVRHLRVRWRVASGELIDAETTKRLGAELAELLLHQFSQLPPAERLRPRPESALAWFRNLAHLRAVCLTARAERHDPAWFEAALEEEPDPWMAACQEGPEAVVAVLGWLVELKTSSVVLADTTAERIERALAILLPAPNVPRALVHALEQAPAVTRRIRTEQPSPPGGRPPERAPSRPDEIVASAPPKAAEAATTERASSGVSAPIDAGSAPPLAADVPSWDTAYAGLFYLAGRVLDLNLSEHLYCAGALEGDVLVHVGRALIGGGDDPAPRLFGGCVASEDPPLRVLPAWAEEEVWSKSLRSLVELAARLGHDAPATDALHAFADRMPPAPLLVRRCAALLGCTFLSRIGEDLTWSALASHLSIPGRIELRDEEMTILLPMKAVDLRLRRAGLDFDPGYLPWLDRKLTLAFVPTDDEAQ